MLSRREFLANGTLASLALSVPGLAFASNKDERKRIILLILRGGMDGLAALPPYADRHYRSGRSKLALPPPNESGGVFDLDGFFGLHPSLAGLHNLFEAGEMVAVAGTAPPYNGRSHFDAQSVLESGALEPHTLRDGWLYRAIETIGDSNEFEHLAMAFGQSVPLVLRGEKSVSSWAPDKFPEPNDDTMARVLDLYNADEVLGPRLRLMMATESMLGDEQGERSIRRSALGQLAESATSFLTHAKGPQFAVLESGGWDTHANQGTGAGSLANRLTALDKVLVKLKSDLGPVWNHTVVLVVTEFGRTVAMNGTRGTDHGVGGAAFLLGGAVKGGRVISDWPGLGPDQLLDGRDLRATIDQRSIFKAVLGEHLGIPAELLDETIFPNSGNVAPLNAIV
ncbi:MAG: DUF1501 domain-containing protein [Pseudomonadales bacterium]